MFNEKIIEVGDTVKVITGFSYQNSNGDIESVTCDMANLVTISTTDDGDMGDCYVYLSDVPKLILALQAMFDLKKGTYGNK